MKRLISILSIFITSIAISQPVITATPSSTIVVTSGSLGTVTLQSTGTGSCTWTKYYDYNLPNYAGTPRTWPVQPVDNSTLVPYGSYYDYCTVSNISIGTWYYQVTNSSGTARIVINVDAYAQPINSSLFETTGNFSNMASYVNNRSMDTTIFWPVGGNSYNVANNPPVVGAQYFFRGLQTLQWVDNMRGKMYHGVRDGYGGDNSLPASFMSYGGFGEQVGTVYVYDWKGFLDWKFSTLGLPTNSTDGIALIFENHPVSATGGASLIVAYKNGRIVPYESATGPSSSDITTHNGYLSGSTYKTTAPGAVDMTTYVNSQGQTVYVWQTNADYWPADHYSNAIIDANADDFFNKAHHIRVTIKEGNPIAGNSAPFQKIEMDGKMVYLRNTGKVGEDLGSDYPLFGEIYDNHSLVNGIGSFSPYRQRNCVLEKATTYIMSGNNAPVLNAGTTQNLSAGITSTTLDGSYSRSDGGYIASLTWSKYSGPAGSVTFGSQGQYITSVSGLTNGIYVFAINGSDNNSLSGSTSYVTVNVGSVSSPPTANAGSDQNLSYGTTSVTLTGTGTPSGGRSITGYLWQLTSGSGVTITNPTLASTTVTGLQAGNTYTFQLTVTDNAGATGQDAVNVTVNSSGGYSSLLTSLISYWKLDELSGLAIDATGVGGGNNNGTQTNTTQGVAGKLNTAYGFNGTSSKIDMGNTSNLSLSGAGSISCWVNISNLTMPSDATVVGKGNTGADRNGYSIGYLNSNHTFWVELANTTSAQLVGFNGITPIVTGTWYNLVVTWDGTTLTSYINGANPTGVPETITPVSTLYNFGIGWSQALNSQFFNGTIDEVGIWGRALTTSEVAGLYNGGAALAYPYGNQITPTITWPNPAAINYPTALSALNSLNATASVGGNHVYTVNGQPALGYVFNAGATNYILDNFFPTDNITYSNAASKQDTIVVNKGTATMSYQSLSSPYTALANPVTVITSPVNLQTVTTLYNNTGTVANGVGSYAISSGLANSNYTAPPISGTYNITQAPVTFSVTNSLQVYDSSQKLVTVTPSIPNLPLVVKYNGSLTAPRYSGTYAIYIRPLDSLDYSGSYSGTLTITKGTVTYTWSPASPITYGTAIGAGQLNAVFSKPGTPSYSPISGTILGAGTQPLSCNYNPTDTNYLPINSIVRNITVNKQLTTISVLDTIQNYDGFPKIISASCPQTGTITILYNGSPNPPTIQGNYPITVTFSSANYYALPYNGTLQIVNNSSSIFITNYQNRLYTGSGISVTVTCSYSFATTYNGSGTPPTATGSYTVIAHITDGIHTGADTVTMTIIQAPSSISYAATKTGNGNAN